MSQRHLVRGHLRARFGIVFAAAVAAVLAGPSLARADLIAAYEKIVPGSGYDIALLNLSTGQQIALPAGVTGVNSTADEIHPTLSADGRLLSFERLTPPALSASASGPVARQVFVFDRSARVQVQPSVLGGGDTTRGAPAISFDGKRIITGSAGDPTRGARVTVTELTSPFTQQVLFTPPGTLLSLATVNPSIGTGAQPAAAWITRRVSTTTTATNPCGDLGFDITCFVPSTDTTLSQTQDLDVLRFPATFAGAPTVLADRPGTDTIAFDHPAVATVGPLGLTDVTAFERLDIVTRTSTSCFISCATSTTRLPGKGDINVVDSHGVLLSPTPAPINTTGDERMPAWSPDGRYLAFVRAIFRSVSIATPPELHNFVFVYDFGTQALVPGMTFDLGRADSTAPSVGSLALAQPPVFTIVCDLVCQRALANGVLSPVKGGTGPLGIIVQRVVGTHRILGRSVPRLRLVGRVPLGVRRAGRQHIRWNQKVNRKSLPPGRYKVTFRALAGKTRTRVRELSRPVDLRVR